MISGAFLPLLLFASHETSCCMSMKNSRPIPPDLVRYRNRYGGNIPNDANQCSNLRFYRNEIPSIPDGDYIDNMHRTWATDYYRLELHHGYIQWLFPIHEMGLNDEAQVLQGHEAEAMKDSNEIMDRIMRSYRMILGFYGVVLEDEETGKLKRAKNYKERYANLNSRQHNYLRITRILKFLGEVGLEKYKLPFLTFFIKEVFGAGHIPNCKMSLATFWVYTLREDADLNACLAYLDRPSGPPPTSALLPPGLGKPEQGGCCTVA